VGGARAILAESITEQRSSAASIPLRPIGALNRERVLDLSLLALATLLGLTTAFSRTFSVIGIDSASIYVTEVLLLISLALALAATGIRAGVQRVVETVPVTALLVMWVAGAIAIARGLAEFGFTQTRFDVGLVEYSILLPLIALVAATYRRATLLVTTLAAGGFVSVLMFASYEFVSRSFGDEGTLLGLPQAGIGIGAAFYLAWITSRWTHGIETARLHFAVVPIAVLTVGLSETRGAWLAMFAAVAAVAILAPTSRTKALAGTGAVLALAFAVAGAAVVEAVLGERNRVAVVSNVTQDGATTVPNPNDGADLTHDADTAVSDKVLGAAGIGAEGANVEWRLAYWGELVSRTPETPLLGVGFGAPAEFVWRGAEYDFRRTDDGTDTYGPHNGFVDVLYRLGVPAFLGLVAIVGIALWRNRRLVRTGEPSEDRMLAVAIVAMFAGAVVTIVFNDALRVPYLAILFWAPLGLLLVAGRRTERGAPGFSSGT
jgi:O-antigen ligase